MMKSNCLCTLWFTFTAFLLTNTNFLFASPVWKVSQVGNESSHSSYLYVAGTVHVLSEDDYPLPQAFDLAYQSSTVLAFETDITKLQSPKYQQYFIKQVTYENGQTLQNTLNASTLASLESHLLKRSIPLRSINKFKPGMVMVMLTMHELQRLGLAGIGVDEFFNQKAIRDDRALMYLESVESQINFMANMGEGDESQFIQHTLNEVGLIPSMLRSTKEAWREGDIKGLETLLMTPLKQEDPKLYQTLLVDRNERWLPKIYDMLSTKDVEFVLVGALHLVGEDGLLNRLQQKGYVVQQLP